MCATPRALRWRLHQALASGHSGYPQARPARLGAIHGKVPWQDGTQALAAQNSLPLTRCVRRRWIEHARGESRRLGTALHSELGEHHSLQSIRLAIRAKRVDPSAAATSHGLCPGRLGLRALAGALRRGEAEFVETAETALR